MPTASLTHVAAVVEDPEVVAATLERAFAGCIRKIQFGSGETVPALVARHLPVLLLAPDAPQAGDAARTGVRHVALGVDDPEAAAASLRADGFGIAPFPAAMPEGRQAFILDPAATAGVRVLLSKPGEPGAASSGSELLERIDHIGIASADNDGALAIFSRAFGLVLESRQTDAEFRITLETFTSDRYGVTQKAGEPELVGGVDVAFLDAGEADLEFLQDIDPLPEGAPRTEGASVRRDRSAIARFIERSGAGLHHIALKVADAEAALAALEAAGCRMLDRLPRPGSRRSRIGFVHPASLGGLLLHVVERQPAPQK